MSKILRILWLLSFSLLSVKLLFSLNIMWQIFNFAFQVDESEGMIVAETLMMDRGADIYALPNPEQFVSAPYTPFYYLLNWPALHFIGASFKPGRFLSFLVAGGMAYLIYLFVRTYTSKMGQTVSNGRLPAILAALTWGSLGLVAFWGGAVKPDLTAIFFNLAGLYLIYTGKTNIYLAAILFALATMTKQTAFAGILVATVWLFLQSGYKQTLRFVGVYLLVAFVPMIAMNWLSNGGFWYHIVTVHELPWDAQNYLKFLGGFVQSYQFFVVFAIGFGLLWLVELFKPSAQSWWPRLKNDPALLILLYGGAALGASFSTGTYGGNHNHLLELAAAGSIMVGALFVRLASLNWQPALVLGLILICWQGLGLLVGEARLDLPLTSPLQAQFLNKDWLGLEYRAPLPLQKERLLEIAALLGNDVSQAIYTDNVSLMLPFHKPIFTTDPFTQTHASRYGRWDQTTLIQNINKQKFGLVVLRRRVEIGGDIYLSPELALAVKNNYRLACSDAWFIYVPLSRLDFKAC